MRVGRKRKVSGPPTAVVPVRMEIPDIVKLEKIVKRCEKMDKMPVWYRPCRSGLITRNTVIAMAIKDFLEREY